MNDVKEIGIVVVKDVEDDEERNHQEKLELQIDYWRLKRHCCELLLLLLKIQVKNLEMGFVDGEKLNSSLLRYQLVHLRCYYLKLSFLLLWKGLDPPMLVNH